MGICGFTPRLPGNTLESATKSPETRWCSKSGPTTLVAAFEPMRAVPKRCVMLIAYARGVEAGHTRVDLERAGLEEQVAHHAHRATRPLHVVRVQRIEDLRSPAHEAHAALAPRA